MAVRRALEAGGVEFIEENGGGPVYVCETSAEEIWYGPVSTPSGLI
jgi:hypothetical protein